MDDSNPYAPPKAEVGIVKHGDCVRDGKLVVIPAGSDLPSRCIVCNAPVTASIKEIKLYWHSPWLYLLILLNILIFIIVGFVVRKSVKVSPGLCSTHSTERKRRILMFSAAGGAAFTVGILLLMANESTSAIMLLLLAFLILVVGVLVSRKVYASRITKEYARLGGCKEPFLASLE